MAKLFPGQQDDEQICMVVREHWAVFLMRFAGWVLFAVILIIIRYVGSNFLPFLAQAPFKDYYNLTTDLYIMFLGLGLLIVWTIYYLNIQVITNERVVDVTQDSLLSRKIAELHLSRVEDVTSEVTGFLETFLNYGNVYVQTAGATERFVFSRVPNPQAIEKMLLDLYEKLPDEQKEHKSADNK